MPLPVFAQVDSRDFSFKGFYKCHLSGINFAKIGIHASQNEAGYSATADINSTGVLDLFVRHSSHNRVTASGAGYDYSKITYETNYTTKKKKRYVMLEYAGATFKKEKLVPPENPAKRPPLDLEQKNTAVDPLTGLFKLRELLATTLKAGKTDFTFNIYDGRRLTQLHLHVIGDRVIRQDNRKIPAIQVQARRTLLAGFTKSELADHDPKEPPLNIYFSNDTTLFPIRLEVQLMFGLLTADLALRCSEGESCLLGNTQ